MTTRLRRNWRRIWIELPLIVWLALVWGALWENFSAANLVFGAILSLLIIRTFRLPPVRLSGRFDVPRAISFFIWFLWQVVRGSFQVIWVALRQGPKVHNAVIEVPLRTREDLMITAIGHVASLIPGSLVLDVDRRHGTLYLHVLNVRTPRDADRFRADVLEIERRLIFVMGTRAEIDLLRDEELRVAKENVAARRRADGWAVSPITSPAVEKDAAPVSTGKPSEPANPASSANSKEDS